ncbi:MAG: threonylcarbamoyl-AMP synthase [Gammaproteobacteria bacterium]|nr:threonylcarbamoyl-AMP synthase [Gammaproteobacteria bacterium]
MAQYFQLHPVNPQARLVKQAVDLIRDGAVAVYPTDSAYALGCHLGDKKALDRLRRIRRVDDKHNFTLVCRDLSEIAAYAKVSNTVYRLLNAFTPGPYTFILEATRDVPRRLLHPKRRTIGIRVPDNKIVLALLQELGEPILSTTLILPGESLPMTDAEDIREKLDNDVDVIIDGGHCGIEPTTVVSLVDDQPVVVRVGCGDPTPFQVS